MEYLLSTEFQAQALYVLAYGWYIVAIVFGGCLFFLGLLVAFWCLVKFWQNSLNDWRHPTTSLVCLIVGLLLVNFADKLFQI